MIVDAGRERARTVVREIVDDIFADPPAGTLSEWADQHYVLPETSARKGQQFRTDDIPYLRKILDTLGDERVRDVVFAKSSQVAGTTVGAIYIAYTIAHRPRAMLSIWPGEKKLEDFSQFVLEPMIANVPAVARKFRRSARRDSSDTKSRKQFLGGWLALLTSMSSSELKSLSAADVIYEEIDEWKRDVNKQGDSLLLAERANRTYPDRKNYKVSTPTMDGASAIWSELEASTWNEYWVPCPHCQEYQTLKWREGDEDPDAEGAYHLIWEVDAGGELIPLTTRYVCGSCGGEIEEHHRMPMLLDGEWRERFPGRYAVGFHINTLYSPLVTFDDIARFFLKAKGSAEKMKVFVNTWLGLPYKARDEKHLDIHFLQQRAEHYGKDVDVPHGVGALFAGVDVQDAAGGWLDFQLWGFGAGEEMWQLGWEQIEGDPSQPEVWRQLEERRLRNWRHASGAPVRILGMAVDANYNTESVHRYTDPRMGQRVIPVIDRQGPGKRLLRSPQQQKYRKAVAYRPSYIVGRWAGLSLLYGRLGTQKEGPGYVHFNEALQRDYYEQLTSFRLVQEYRKGIPFRGWQRLQDRRTEALVGTIYAMAAFEYMAMNVAGFRLKVGEMAKTLSAYRGPAGSEAAPAEKARRRGLVSEQTW